MAVYHREGINNHHVCVGVEQVESISVTQITQIIGAYTSLLHFIKDLQCYFMVHLGSSEKHGGWKWRNMIDSPGAKMGTWKCFRVQGFMIDPESIGVFKKIKLGCHDGNLGEFFLFA